MDPVALLEVRNLDPVTIRHEGEFNLAPLVINSDLRQVDVPHIGRGSNLERPGRRTPDDLQVDVQVESSRQALIEDQARILRQSPASDPNLELENRQAVRLDRGEPYRSLTVDFDELGTRLDFRPAEGELLG